MSSTTHREVPDDDPAPMGLLRQQERVPAREWSRGPFTSIQVNVDAGGNNIVGDAANEPSYAIDPTDPNKMAIGWRQFDTIESNFRQAGVAYSQDGGQTWTFPGVLEPGQFRSDPVLAADANGNFYYSSLSALDSIEIFKSTDGGVTWSFPPTYAFGGDKQWMTVDRTAGIGSGNVYQDWNVQFTCCYPNDFTRSIDGAASFQSPIAIPQPSLKWGTLDVGPGGELYLAGATLNQSSHVIARSSDAQNPVVTPTFDFVNSLNLGGNTFGGAPNPGGLAGQVWVATDHSGGATHGNVYVLASVWPTTGETLDVMFIRSTDGGVTWSTPVRVNDDPNFNGAYQWFGTMSVAPNGRIDAVWNDTRNTGADNLSELFYTFSEDAGVTWSANVPVSPVFDSWLGWPQQNKLGDYYHMISDNEGANLAYAATFNGEQDVYFIRMEHDCNENGIDDDCDVSCGPPSGRCDVTGCGGSDDCNSNNIPDECEADQDCNENAVRDLCDIAVGTSQDCNWNDVPDECELGGNDCNNNGIPDDCELARGTGQDCNENGIVDECDIASGYSEDCQPDGVPDDCQLNDPVILPDLGPCSATATPGDSWCDDLESYAPGSIQGLNGWQGWGSGAGDPGAAGTVTTQQNHSSGGSQSLRIDAFQDTVRLFSGYNLATSPLWVFRAWVYIPSAIGAEQAMLIFLADYDGGGAGTSWAVQLGMDAWNVWSNETGDWLDATSDSWAEIRLEIDYEQDSVDIFYNDTFLTAHAWSGGGGSMNLGAIDLFSPGVGQFYFDDLSLIKPLTTDCNENEIPDECDITSGHSEDSDGNGIPDACEGGPRACCLLDGTCLLALAEDCLSLGGVALGSGAVCLGDNNGDGTDDACLSPCGHAPEPDPRVNDVGFGTRNRYLSFVPGEPGEVTAVRVTFADLPPDYETYEGDSWWVGEPVEVTELSNSADSAPSPTFWAAPLRCGTSFYTDWSTYGAPIHVHDAGIIPDGEYVLQAIDIFCDPDVESSYSDPLVIRTSRMGDVVGTSCANCPCSSPQGEVDFVDISAIVDKFRNLPCVEGSGPGVLLKSRADVINSNMTASDVDRLVDFVDISSVVDAFRDLPQLPPGPQQHCTTP